MSIVSVFEDESNRKKAQRWCGEANDRGRHTAATAAADSGEKNNRMPPNNVIIELLRGGKTLLSIFVLPVVKENDTFSDMFVSK